MIIQGRALLVGDDVDTDAIIPARYLVTTDPAELGRHCLEGLDRGSRKGSVPGTSWWRGRTSAVAPPGSTRCWP